MIEQEATDNVMFTAVDMRGGECCSAEFRAKIQNSAADITAPTGFDLADFSTVDIPDDLVHLKA